MEEFSALFARCDSIVVFDTETSGLSFEKDDIIEFSAVRLERREGKLCVTAQIDELIRRDRPLPPQIVALTGITDEMLREDGISKEAFATLLAELFTEKTLLVAYNAQFDLLFLYHFLAKYGDARLLKDKGKLDLLTVYRDRHAYPHRLCNAIEAYGLEGKVQNSHRAIDDVLATVEVMKEMEAEEADLEKYIDLFGYMPKYGVSGQRIASVQYLPQGYRGEGKLYDAAHSLL